MTALRGRVRERWLNAVNDSQRRRRSVSFLSLALRLEPRLPPLSETACLTRAGKAGWSWPVGAVVRALRRAAACPALCVSRAACAAPAAAARSISFCVQVLRTVRVICVKWVM